MTVIALNRDDLTRLFPNNPKAVLAFEALFFQAKSASDGVTAGVASTDAIKDAAVITLSGNTEFTSERVLASNPLELQLQDGGPGSTLTLVLVNNVTTQGGYSCVFNLASDTALDLPSSGMVLTDAFLSEGPFADDTAAAASGVAVGRPYRRSDGVVAWRVT